MRFYLGTVHPEFRPVFSRTFGVEVFFLGAPFSFDTELGVGEGRHVSSHVAFVEGEAGVFVAGLGVEGEVVAELDFSKGGGVDYDGGG